MSITQQIVNLADKGYTVVEIRDQVNRRYQQVRNTLLRKGYEIQVQEFAVDEIIPSEWDYIDPQSGIPQYAA
jgi:hypothetical protein